MLQIHHLSKHFGAKHAVSDLDLEIKPGEIFGFLGPNGAGKTTTIKLIAGLLKPTEGQVKINGFDAHREPLSARQSLAYIPDEPYLYEKLTGRECLELVGHLHGVDKLALKPRIEELLKLFHIEEFANQFTEGFSHGTRQKFVFAAALLHRPQLLLIDEPMVGLDPQHTHLVKSLLKQVAAANQVTVFLSTHTLSLAQEICHRIGIIHLGRLVAYGTLTELQEQAKSEDQNLENLYLKLTSLYDNEILKW